MQFEFLQDASHVVPKALAGLLARNMKAAINTVFFEARRMVKSAATRNSKNRTGEDRHPARLQETVMLDKATVSTHYARLWTENPVWAFRNEDMPAHEIRAREGGVLAFTPKGGGGVIFAKVVQHPGSTGLHIWEKAEEYVEKNLDREIDIAFRMTLDEQQYTGRAESGFTG